MAPPAYLEGLNPEQHAAVSTQARRVLVLAGAGSGKTKTLIARLAQLVASGYDPERLVLVTFTHRAAREMTQRTAAVLGPAARKIWAGTFHALAYRVLRQHAALSDGPPPTVLGGEDQKELLARVIAEQAPDTTARRFPGPKTLLSLRGLSIGLQEPLESVVQRYAPDHSPWIDAIDKVLAGYQQAKARLHFVDFDDLLWRWHEALGPQSPVADRLRKAVDHVLVDEFQDTTPIQASISERLAADGHLFVVGDDAQSIYGFRGARFENILNFPRRPGTEVHALTRNYRSTAPILNVANQTIAQSSLQFPKKLTAERRGQGRPVRVSAASQEEEAAFVAQHILALYDRGVGLEQQAILYRAHRQTAPLELELTRRNIPYVVRSGLRFFEQAHIRDALAFVRIMANPDDELAWMRVLSMRRHIGPKTIHAILSGSQPSLAPSQRLQSALPSLDARRRTELLPLVEYLLRLEELRRPAALLRRLVHDAEPAVMLEHFDARYDDPAARVADVEQLAVLAHGFDDHQSFVSGLALVGDAKSEAGQRNSDDTSDAGFVTLSSIHQAKGLEWRAVFVVGLNEGTLPFGRADDVDDLAEERRLFYVAVTRAREELLLCHPAASARSDGDLRILPPSRFLTELDEDSLEHWELTGG